MVAVEAGYAAQEDIYSPFMPAMSYRRGVIVRLVMCFHICKISNILIWLKI